MLILRGYTRKRQMFISIGVEKAFGEIQLSSMVENSNRNKGENFPL